MNISLKDQEIFYFLCMFIKYSLALMYYYISLGCNINRKKNSFLMIRNLLDYFPQIYLYPFILTPPEKMTTTHTFSNALCIIESDLRKEQIKAIFNDIETSMGRDKNDPLSYCKDRPADIDILFTTKYFDPKLFETQKEQHILSVLNPKSDITVDASFYGLPLFEKPSTIYFDLRTRNIVISNEVINRFQQR